MTDEELVRKFTREMMGSSVAHMNDEQLDAWMKPWRTLAGVTIDPALPTWFVKRRNEVRSKLLAVLIARSGV